MPDSGIREMSIEDYDKVYNLWRHTKGIGLSEADSKESISRFLERNKHLCFVCEIAGEIVGTVLCGHDGRRGYIHHLAVSEKYRKNGFAKKLILQCFNQLKEEKIYKCHLFVFKNNELGISFWTKTGWVKREDLFVFSKTF